MIWPPTLFFIALGCIFEADTMQGLALDGASYSQGTVYAGVKESLIVPKIE